MRKFKWILFLRLVFLSACKKSGNGSIPQPPAPVNYNYTSEYTYNLNVIYFVASGKTPNDDYHRRISEIMLQGQDFFNTWMKTWGYGDKTFGLLADKAKGRIRIIEIQGKFDQSHYPYNGGADAILAEVNAHFATYPGDKTSDHNLIITCVKNIAQDNAPFFGLGNNCFALDYPGMDKKDLGAGGSLGSEATAWIGGMMHELGHGINLPHNGGTKPENSQYGTTLMGTGNSTYGKAPTYLSKAECAILNNCQVFSKTAKTNWYAATNTSITRLNARYENGKIVVSGRFTGNGNTTDINFYNDGGKNGIGGNKDYDAVTWSAPEIGTDSFYIAMPFNEFTNTEDFPYELRIMFCNENGSVTTVAYPYKITGGQPVIDFGDKNEYDKTNWQLIDFSSQETVSEDGKASNVLDKNRNTSWITRWSSSAPTFPHYIVIDMAQLLPATGFTLTQRNGSSKIKDMQILTSNDNVSWTTAGNYVLNDAAGPQHIYLPALTTFRYFKLAVTSATDGRQFASLAEVGVFKD